MYAGGISRAYALSDAFKASLQVRPVPDSASACVLLGTSVKGRADQRNASLYSGGNLPTLAQLMVVATHGFNTHCDSHKKCVKE